MPDLQNLPEELLVLICQHLRNQDLCNAARCCKALHRSTLKALYQSPRCQEHGDNDSHTSLLHAIVAQPRLATLVHHLRVNYFRIKAQHRQTLERARTSINAASVFCLAPASDHHFGSLWQALAWQSTIYSDDLALALLLYYAPNLESLMLGNDHFGNDPTVPSQMGETIDSTLFLQALELVPTFTRPDGSKLLGKLNTIILMNPRPNKEPDDFMHRIRPGRWSRFQICQLFGIPTLETFIATDLFEPIGKRTAWFLSEHFSYVTTIRLLRCNVSTKAIRSLLQSCDMLRAFHWTVTCGPSMYEPELRLDCNHFYPELLKFKSTLKFLGLYSECRCDDPCSTSHVGTIDSLLPLENLENLIIQEAGQDFAKGYENVDLYNHNLENLPDSLKELTFIMSKDENLEDYIEDMVLTCQSNKSLRAVLFTPGAIPYEVDQLSKHNAGLSFKKSFGEARGRTMNCLIVQHQGRGDVRTAAEDYDALIAAAYAPYEGGNPHSESDEYGMLLEKFWMEKEEAL